VEALGTEGAGATSCPSGSIPAGAGCIDAKPVFIDKCVGVQKALRFYTKRWQHWTTLRTGVGQPVRQLERSPQRCPRYLLKIRKAKAAAAHREWNRYFHYHYAWSEWLPDKWQRIGACETGYGRRPGNWRHSNSSYEGAFGFAKVSWDSFKYRADPKAGPYPEDAWQATPRQQYEVALAIYRMYGLSGWGCRNA